MTASPSAPPLPVARGCSWAVYARQPQAFAFPFGGRSALPALPVRSHLVRVVVTLVALAGALSWLSCALIWSRLGSVAPLWAEALLAALTLAALLLAFEGGLWHTRVGRWLGWPLPDLRGTWRGLITPTSLPPGTVNPGALMAFLVVRQSALRVRVTLYTLDRQAEGLRSAFLDTPQGLELVYTYRSVPRLSPARQVGPVLGTTTLRLEDRVPRVLQGRFVTGRGTSGELRLLDHCVRTAHTYGEALALPYGSRR
ncbi:hypothetical protein [Deinococcus hopiensis]|uniref:Uncharacterized protein n=1 Tax=Deinococcus hopiensis KR-140 TaxID=695939 RepID=A0A1W1UD79_9DEIO|nr:hypothetical protein [Deinococcus hopiensis]SMB79019.1 hypothetical protein SAMN00790413_05730 [Deinococcus hopiensis KR-140]